MFQLVMGDVGAAASGAKTVPYHPLRVYGYQDRLSVLKSTQTRLSQPPQELDVASVSRLEAVEQMYHQLQVQVKELHQAVDIMATHISTLTSLLERNATPPPASPSSTQNVSLLGGPESIATFSAAWFRWSATCTTTTPPEKQGGSKSCKGCWQETHSCSVSASSEGWTLRTISSKGCRAESSEGDQGFLSQAQRGELAGGVWQARS